MSSQTTKSNITKMITDSVIDDFAAVLLGRLKLEARESQAGRQGGFFFQLLHDNLKAATWLGALLRNWQGEKKLFFSVRFLLQFLYFNMRIRCRDSMEKVKAPGEKEKPDSIVRVCNFCMQPFSSCQCSCILCWIILGPFSLLLDDFYVFAVWAPSVSALNMLLLPANKRY